MAFRSIHVDFGAIGTPRYADMLANLARKASGRAPVTLTTGETHLSSERLLVSRLLLGPFIATVIATATLHASQAAEMRLNVMGSASFLDIEGVIEPGDYERFLRIAKDSQGKLVGVSLYSPGGDFLEAIKIGKALRALEISSQVPMRTRDGRAVCEKSAVSTLRNSENCTAASAAFFIHIGAIHRGGTYLAVHRPHFDPSKFRNLSQTEAQVAYGQLLSTAKDYMNEMAIPSHVQEEVLNTPSDKTVLLDERAIRTHIWGDLPHRYEWRRAKCSRMTPKQAQRYQELTQKPRLDAHEREEWRALDGLNKEESRCEIALVTESRRVAYTKFFAISPSDVIGHDFSKWLAAPRYLGRTFEDVTSEERFEPGIGLAGSSVLEKQATSKSPATTLMDSKAKKRFVSWVSVYHEAPSEEFMETLRGKLTASWGKPSVYDETWHWNTGHFKAILEHHAKERTPFVTLVIEAVSN